MTEPRPQLQRGADEELSVLLGILGMLDRFLEDAVGEIRTNPGLCYDDLMRAQTQSRKLRRRLEHELREMLRRREKRASEDEARAQLEAATEALRAALERLEPENVSRPDFRKGEAS